MPGLMRRRIAVVTCAALVAATGLVIGVGPAASAAAAPTTWLCRPDMADSPCEHDLTATAVAADGTPSVVVAKPATHPKIDCFYVYPTVSGQTTNNADLTIDPEETAVAEQQASRFSQVCRVFAPMYRQVTIQGLFKGGDQTAGFKLAYSDVLAAWRDYLAHDNKGRGVVLIGHSQGSGMLLQLLSTQIDAKPALRRRIVSALLIGGRVTVPEGKDVGGSFQHLPACRTEKQTQCVVAYNSFDTTPPADSLFGRVGELGSSVLGSAKPGDHVLCVNPATLGTESGPLDSFFKTAPFPSTLGAVEKPQFDEPTPWVETPGQYTATCMENDDSNWLQVDHDASDTRPAVFPALGATWGLHLVDVNLALGNLVDLVRTQAKAYAAK